MGLLLVWYGLGFILNDECDHFDCRIGKTLGILLRIGLELESVEENG